MGYLLDEHVFIDYWYSQFNINTAIQHFINIIDKKTIFISVITVAEISKGFHNLKADSKFRKYIKDGLYDFLAKHPNKIITPSYKDAVEYGRLIKLFPANDHISPNDFDTWLSAIANIQGHIIVTRNTKDFPHCMTINPYQI